MSLKRITYAFTLFFILTTFQLPAQSKDGDAKDEGEMPSGPPPAAVIVAPVSEGILAPDGEYLGTLYYNRIANVATEIKGRVDEIFFDTGQKVKKDQVLVRLNADLLEQGLQTAESTLEQLQAELEKAKLDFERSSRLFKQASVSEQTYDEDRFAAITKEKEVNGQIARCESIRTELKKKTIAAPFDGVILEKETEVGEWLNEGGEVARIAFKNEIDLIANVPQEILTWLKPGSDIEVRINGKAHTAKLNAIIPEGDIATRTFPVRVRLSPEAEGDLFEGMQGYARFPTGPEQQCLFVSRDAVITMRGDTIVYAVENGAAVIHPVKVLGYKKGSAGVESPTLKPGMKVVTKGNERLQPGQPVNPSDSLEPVAPMSSINSPKAAEKE